MNDDMINLLKDRLTYIINMEQVNIYKLYEELLHIFPDSFEEYVIKRHEDYKKQGLTNKEIFPLVINEVKHGLFKGPDLSPRQIKRIIYGD